MKKHPWIGCIINIQPHHFQLSNDDFEEMEITKEKFYGPCKIYSIDIEMGDQPDEMDYVLFEKFDGTIFPNFPINFYELPKELKDLL